MPVGEQFFAVPCIGKYMARMGVSVSTARTVADVRAIGLQFAAYQNVPFYGPCLKKVQELVGVGVVADLHDELKYNSLAGVRDPIPLPDIVTYDWFARIYGVTLEDEHLLHIQLATVYALPWSLDPTPYIGF
jgi:hypothetical protein